MSLTILLVEDDGLVASALKETLEDEGWGVTLCSDGACALNHIAAPTPYDLLITDNQLPHADGLDLVRYARHLTHREHLPVIMLSASDCEAEALAAGVNLFLRKPEGITRLISAVRDLFAGTPPYEDSSGRAAKGRRVYVG